MKGDVAVTTIKIGYALTGSFCTFEKAIVAMQELVELGYEIHPIMSHMAYTTDTRFGKAIDFANRLETISGNSVIHTITGAEPIGPQNLLDLMIVAPCTGNTLGKLAAGITDTSVTMAVKAHLRNQKPVLIGVSTNDALSGTAKNIGLLLNAKNVFFVPMSQDDPQNKTTSVVAHFDQLIGATLAALDGRQLQPIFVSG